MNRRTIQSVTYNNLEQGISYPFCTIDTMKYSNRSLHTKAEGNGIVSLPYDYGVISKCQTGEMLMNRFENRCFDTRFNY